MKKGRRRPPPKAASRGRGGARPGAGRPSKAKLRAQQLQAATATAAAGAIPWDQVREYAEAGVEAPTILAALEIDEAALKASGALAEFRRRVELGHEVCRAELMVQIKRRSTRTHEGDGSVNAMQLRARNLLGWDRQSLQDEQKPDLSGAHERLRFILEKLAANKTAELGRAVAPAAVLLEDLYPDDLGSA